MKITIRGAGIIGLSCADELVRRGHDVTVVDPAPGSGASHAAAGMLAPSAEVWWSEAALLEFGLGSLELWPVFADRTATCNRWSGSSPSCPSTVTRLTCSTPARFCPSNLP
jgi:glycine oxidase